MCSQVCDGKMGGHDRSSTQTASWTNTRGKTYLPPGEGQQRPTVRRLCKSLWFHERFGGTGNSRDELGTPVPPAPTPSVGHTHVQSQRSISGARLGGRGRPSDRSVARGAEREGEGGSQGIGGEPQSSTNDGPGPKFQRRTQTPVVGAWPRWSSGLVAGTGMMVQRPSWPARGAGGPPGCGGRE